MDDLRKIDLNLLLTLHALLSEKHVTRAALRLHRSQPAVSHSLALLREHFYDPLLIRKNGKMTLSARAHTLMPPLVSHLRENAPGLDLAISQASREMMLAQLEEGEADLVLGVFPDVGDELQTETLFSERFICLADRRFLPASGNLTREEWLAKPHVQLAAKPDAVDEIEKALLVQGLSRHICIALPHWSAAVNLLVGTDLVLTIASRAVVPEACHKAICRFEPPLHIPGFNFEQAWHARKNGDPAHQWLRRVIRDCCQSLNQAPGAV